MIAVSGLDGSRAFAIRVRVSNRFFFGFDRRRRVRTAWSIAGAKLYVRADDAARDLALIWKRHAVDLVSVAVQEVSDAR